MLEMKRIRDNPQIIRDMLSDRNVEFDLDGFLEMDVKWRELVDEGNRLKHERNEFSKEIGKILFSNDKEEKARIIEKTKHISNQIKSIDEEQRALKDKIDTQRLGIPNIPFPDVPRGSDENQNTVVRVWGEVKDLGFKEKNHYDLGRELGILDLERGAKITGSGFYVLKGLGSRLERALINFMLDFHAQKGYTEVLPPFVVNSKSMTGTGQLPKFEFDMYKITEDDLYLVPTAEVPITNLHREEILDKDQLPIKYCAYTACFRREAGRHADEKGIIRVHQFNKVELVKFTTPQQSGEELETLTSDAEQILKALKIPYRVLLLCTGDLGFGSAKTYDIEAYASGQKRYLEVSSCSNYADFQARRAGIKYRPQPHLPSEFVHTLNGSGLAIGRVLVTILENYQQPDGSVVIPEVLRPYMNGEERIGPA